MMVEFLDNRRGGENSEMAHNCALFQFEFLCGRVIL